MMEWTGNEVNAALMMATAPWRRCPARRKMLELLTALAWPAAGAGLAGRAEMRGVASRRAAGGGSGDARRTLRRMSSNLTEMLPAKDPLVDVSRDTLPPRDAVFR